MDDISRAKLLYGSPAPILQGKMTRFKPKGANIEIVPLTLRISQHHKDLQLYMDFFFVNGYPFLATKTNKANLNTGEPCISRTTSHTTKAIDTVLELYEAICFNITAVHGDNYFNIKTLKTKLPPICTHIYGKEEHVGIIERMIRLIKESAICMCHAITYQYYTKLVIQ